MLKFPIPPEFCLIVNAFSQTNSLRQAAVILQTDPAGLVRKVQKISSDYGFLQKVGNRWIVTDSGQRIALWSDEVIARQQELINEKPQYRLSAYSWLAEEMLIPNFKKLDDLYDGKVSWFFKMTASDLEKELISNRSDFVLTGHAPNDPLVAHKRISTFQWVVVVPESWKKTLHKMNSSQQVDFLNSRPFLRHSGMSPSQILGFTPNTFSALILDGVIGLRAAVINELGWSAVPAMSVSSPKYNHGVYKMDIPTHVKDDVSIWWLRARRDSAAQVKYLSKWVSDFKWT